MDKVQQKIRLLEARLMIIEGAAKSVIAEWKNMNPDLKSNLSLFQSCLNVLEASIYPEESQDG